MSRPEIGLRFLYTKIRTGHVAIVSALEDLTEEQLEVI